MLPALSVLYTTTGTLLAEAGRTVLHTMWCKNTKHAGIVLKTAMLNEQRMAVLLRICLYID